MDSIMWNGFQTFSRGHIQDLPLNTVIGVMYIEIVGFSKLERTYGHQVGRELLELTYDLLQGLTLELSVSSSWSASSYYVWDDCFAVLLISDGTEYSQPLTYLASNLVHELEDRISNCKAAILETQTINFRVGTQTIVYNNQEIASTFHAQLYNAFVQASRQAKQSGGVVSSKQTLEFEQILQEKEISTVFQPIVELKNHEIFGYEALSRGPQGSDFFSPDQLIRTAEKLGALYALERVFRESGIKSFGNQLNQQVSKFGIRNSTNLFMNIHPQSIHDPNFINGETMRLVHRYGLSPAQIIIEITEHQAIQDYSTFLKSINHYRRQGYRIAIDDTGAGYAGLQTIVELNPDFIKLDMSIVRDVDQNPKKQIMIDTMVKMGKSLHAKIIAEGIETPDELKVVKRLGVQYGQGYLLGKPHPTIAKLNRMLC